MVDVGVCSECLEQKGYEGILDFEHFAAVKGEGIVEGRQAIRTLKEREVYLNEGSISRELNFKIPGSP